MTAAEYKKTAKKQRSYPEEDLQIACVQWFKTQYPDLEILHIPNGGSRSFRVSKNGRRYSPEGDRLNKMGLRKGTSDLFIPEPRRGYHGLWIEMKADKNSKLSGDQQEFVQKMAYRGYACYKAYALGMFITIVTVYLRPGATEKLVPMDTN